MKFPQMIARLAFAALVIALLAAGVAATLPPQVNP